MNNVLRTLGYVDSNSYRYKMTNTLSCYTEKLVKNDGTVKYYTINTDYFLKNDIWRMDFFGSIAQFKEDVESYTSNTKTLSFPFANDNLNLEMKFIVYNKIFTTEWNLYTCIRGQRRFIERLALFINETYPSLDSFLHLDLDKATIRWVDWLTKQDIATTKVRTKLDIKYQTKSPIVYFLSSMASTLFTLTDEREEWVKDKWNMKNLQKYGITYNKSKHEYFIDFSKIKNEKIKEEVKKYIKQRLISNHKFSAGTATNYLTTLPAFINVICELEPTWNDFKALERKHIIKYIEWLNTYAKNQLTQKNAHPEHFIAKSLGRVEKFLTDIQIREYDIAPQKNVRILICPEDKPSPKKKSYDQIDYVPDYVLEQLFEYIHELPKRYIPVLWIMYKTGLRVSDALMLTQRCLVKLNGSYWIETDIEKTYVEGHRIPIDEELANMLLVLIRDSKEKSNQDNNPNNYIFVSYTGRRKGQPYAQRDIRTELNILATKYKITDELGNKFHFKNHAFRHTYAIKMLNGGADILTVQELLAHASPEMTLQYAKLLDDTKRKAFDKVHKQGVFSFQRGTELVSEVTGEIPEDILDMLWQNHKLNAIDTPYGTCLQRTNGKCQFAKQPPCLTCNGGNPCRDLCVGAFEGDIQKYEILIGSTKSMIENAKVYNRTDMLRENEEILSLYEDIYNKITEGNIIYSKLNRLKKGDING